MLAEYPIHAALPAMDMERARRFYTETGGLTPESEGPDGLFFRCGGVTRFLLFPSGGAASGTHTQMTWNTPDIEATVAELQACGVVFEEYDTPEVKTVNGVATLEESKGAWFKDSEGKPAGSGPVRLEPDAGMTSVSAGHPTRGRGTVETPRGRRTRYEGPV